MFESHFAFQLKKLYSVNHTYPNYSNTLHQKRLLLNHGKVDSIKSFVHSLVEKKNIQKRNDLHLNVDTLQEVLLHKLESIYQQFHLKNH